MRAKFFKVICIILAATLTGGCWNAKDINDQDIAMAVVVDLNENGYFFYVEIASIEGVSGVGQSDQGQMPKPYIITAGGKTFAEAREILDRKINKELFIGAIQSLMITPRMAENGIGEYLYRVRQMNEYRKTIDVIVITGDPMQFLVNRPENVLSVGFAVESTLEALQNTGKLFRVSLSDVLEKLASKNDSYVLLKTFNESGLITPDSFAVFDGPKMVGEISNIEEMHGTIYIASYNTVPDSIHAVPAGNTHATIEAKMKGRSITAYYEENRVRFKLDFSFEGIMQYPETAAPVTEQMHQELKTNMENMLMQEISAALLTSRDKFGLDYLSLSEAFRIKYPDIYKNMDWKSEFKNATFDISVNSTLCPDKTFDYNPGSK